MRKKVFFLILIVMGLALIGFALFKGREKIKVSALTYPYSLVSAVNTSDEIDNLI